MVAVKNTKRNETSQSPSEAEPGEAEWSLAKLDPTQFEASPWLTVEAGSRTLTEA